MAYGLSPALFVENGPTIQAATALARRSTTRTWRSLDQDRRLALVERALSPDPANDDSPDDFPIAL
jgi:hypothetical protein